MKAEDGTFRIPAQYLEIPEAADTLTIRPLEAPDALAPGWLAAVDRTPLASKQVDLLLAIPPDFTARLERGDHPALHLLSREGDDRSRLLNGRVHYALGRWKQRLKELRLLRRGLPPDFDDVFTIDNPERAKAPARGWPRGCSRCWCASFRSCW